MEYEDYVNKMSKECFNLLREFWEEEEIVEGLKDTVKFITETINPFLKDLRSKGKNLPIVQFDRRGGNNYFLIVSTERR